MRAACGVVSARSPSMRPLSWSTSLKVLQVELAAGARQQRLEVLEQRRHHQLEAVAAGPVEQARAAAPRRAAPAPAGHRRCARAAAKQRHEKRPVLKAALYGPTCAVGPRPPESSGASDSASSSSADRDAGQADEADLPVGHLRGALERRDARRAGSGRAAGPRRPASAPTRPAAGRHIAQRSAVEPTCAARPRPAPSCRRASRGRSRCSGRAPSRRPCCGRSRGRLPGCDRTARTAGRGRRRRRTAPIALASPSPLIFCASR